MSLQSTITQTDGTVRATTWVGLLYQLMLLGQILQGRYNRAKPKFKKNAFSIDYKFDGETTSFVSTAQLEGQRLIPEGETKPVFVVDKTFSDYIRNADNEPVAFDGGTGALAGIETFEEALIYTAEMVSYLESQIEPDLLLKEVNIVNLTPQPEDGADTLSVTVPMRNIWDEAIGQAKLLPKNYLYIIDVADSEGI
jgi:hypothetical protein